MSHLERNTSIYTDAEIITKIKAATKPFWVLPIKARNGDKAFSIQKVGKVVEAFDKRSPRKYAKEVAHTYTLARTEAMVLVGAGCGHVINAVLRKAEPGFTLVVVEPELYLVKEALSNYDFRKHMEAKRLLFATSRDEVAGTLSYVNTAAVVENWYVVVNPYVAVLPEIYFEISDYVGNTLNSLRCNTGTMSGAGAQIAYNDLANIPYLIQFPGVIELKDLYKGRPAVVVSTGPSLERNVHLLLDKKYRDSVVVICVAQAARILLAYGITPDYMCTVDYGEVNASHFSGLEECGVPLVALNRTYAPIFEKWKSPIYVATSIQTPRGCVSDAWLSRGGIEQGGSVSHFAFGLAMHLGCSPVALMGQDLAYEGDKSHNSLADSSGGLKIENGNITWQVDDPRSPIYKKDYAMGPALPVDGYFGDPVVTNVGLASFIHSFSALSELFKHRSRLYDCTEGGALIPGFRPTTLQSFLNRFAKHSFPHLREEFHYNMTWKEDVDSILKIMEADVKNLQALIHNADKGVQSANKMEIFVGDKHRGALKSYCAAKDENEKASNAAQECAKLNPLLESAIYGASREIAGKDLFVSGKHVDKDDAAFVTRIKRNRHILTAARREAEKLLKTYAEVREKLELLLIDETAMRQGEPQIPSIEDAGSYLEKGNWGLPLLEIQRMAIHDIALEGCDKVESLEFRCHTMRKAAIARGEEWQKTQQEREKKLRFSLLVKAAKIAGSRQQNFRKAYLCLRKAHDLFPDDDLTWYGLASSLTMLKRHTEAWQWYDKLLEKHPDVEQYRFERMLVMLSAGEMVDGFAELESLLVINEEKYGHVLFMAAQIVADVKQDTVAAAKIMRRYLQRYSENPEAWHFLYKWTGDHDAKRKYEKLSR